MGIDKYTVFVYYVEMISNFELTSKVKKQLKKVPRHIVQKLLFWVMEVEENSLESTRKIPGWHDEPLKGKRRGQRSIRLSKAWRAIYVINDDGEVEFVEVIEVNKHEY